MVILAGLLTVVSHGAAAVRGFGLKEVRPEEGEKSGLKASLAILKDTVCNRQLLLLVLAGALFREVNQTITVFLNQLQYTRAGMSARAISVAYMVVTVAGISLEDNKQDIPVPSDQSAAIEKVQQDSEIIDFSKGILTYVDVDFSEYRRKVDTKTVRRNVALPSWLDYEAEHAGINVSRVLQEALMSTLKLEQPI